MEGLEVGNKFESTEAAKQFIRDFNATNFTEFIVETNSNRCLVFSCKHSVKRDSKSKGKRIHSHFNYLACPAKIRMYKSQSQSEAGTVKVTKINLDHSHTVAKEIYESQHVVLTEEEQELIKTLKEANVKDSQVQRVLLERSKKKVTIQKLKNLIQKMSPSGDPEDAKKQFETFLENTEDDGGVIDWLDDKDGKMKALFISSSKMKAAFRSCNPPLLQTDTSFEFEKSRYKVCAFCYLDTNSDRSEIAAYALMSEESGECFQFVLSHLAKICCRQDLIFLVDKDFTEISSIRKVFPLSVVLLCIFHCLKFMRTLFSTIPDTVEVKEEVMDQFKKVLYSHTEEIFLVENEKLLQLIEKLEVRTDGKYVSLKGYYTKNWMSCKLMWVRCYRKKLPLLGDNTTNRIENKFGVLKKSIADTFVTLPDTSAAIIHLVNHADRLLQERYTFGTNRRLKIFSPVEEIRRLNEEASSELNDKGCKIFNTTLNSLEKKRDKLKKSEETDEHIEEMYDDEHTVTYVTTDATCSCSAFSSYQAPCVHIVFRRELDKLDNPNKKIFDAGLFHSRYHRKEVLIDVLRNPSSVEDDDDTRDHADDEGDFLAPVGMLSEEPFALDDRQKYKKIMPQLLRIGNLVCAHSTKKFLEYLTEFEKVENYVRKGDCIFEELELVDAGVDENETEVLVEQAPPYNNEDENVEHELSLDSTVPETPSVSERVSKFANLMMKERLKTKGRPKRKSKQLTFNKTAADRKLKKPRKANPKSATKKSKKRKDYIEDESTSEELEDIADLMDDESGDDCEELSGERSFEDDESGRFEVNDEFFGDEGDEGDEEITFNNNMIVQKKCFICKLRIANPEQMLECYLCSREAHAECYIKYKCKDCAEARAADEASLF